MEFISHSNNDTIEFAYNFGKSLQKGDVILMTGDLGCGKTTFTKGIGKALNVTKNINSPTFTILKIYKGDINLHHMDFYRLENTNLYDFDLAEYITDETVNVIEWPFMKEDYLPSSYILVDLTYIDENTRKIKITYVGNKYSKEL